MHKRLTLTALTALASCVGSLSALAGIVEGVVTDADTGETLMGAAVTYADGKGTSTDMDGLFTLSIPDGQYTLTVRYIGYVSATMEVAVANTQHVEIRLRPDNATLENVMVVGEARHNTEAALVREQQTSHVAMISVSEQHIKRTQDKDASEVIRRIPGISIIDEKFVMVRGLSQRYNNVWMNGCAVPSSEADQRAFSFDIIPSAQIDNLKVVRTAAPEYPADFAGGFIIVNTKDVPTSKTWSVSVGGSMNDRTHLRDQLYYKGGDTDFLGFDDGTRGLSDGIHTSLTTQRNGFALQQNGLNNDWTVRTRKPLADLSLAGTFSQRWHTSSGPTLGLNACVNYGNTYRTLTDVTNNLFGAYDVTHDASNYLRRCTDNQHNKTNRLGALLNFIWLSADGTHRLELKQIFNQMGKSRYTNRRGYDAQSDFTEQAEYYYQSRTTYNVGMQGKHTFSEANTLDWNVGYAYANRNLPDRRRFTTVMQENGEMEIDNLNDINREFSFLGEHIASGGANWRHDFATGMGKVALKVGAYGEHKNRQYDTRFFTYAWPFGQMPQSMRTLDVASQLLTADHYGPDGLYLLEQVDWTNNYEAGNTLGCGYASLLVPLCDNRLEAYGGLRFESSHTELTSHTRRQERSPHSTRYDYDDIFPSLNLTWHINSQHQIRAAYGRTTNRPEFREISTSVYFDFDLASNVQGNHNLKPAYMDNFDLGWECYPNAGEVLSLSLFRKHFSHPIEWTYTVAGGTDLVYSYMNAESAVNYGVELDVRKQLDFVGLPLLSLSLNAALIHSSVNFPSGSRERDRPMQGQSPYLINAGLFFHGDPDKTSHPWAQGLTASLLYNTIGKRIVGVGRSIGSSEVDVRVPDSYEMPRHQLDTNVGKSFGKMDVRLSVRDALAQKVEFKQFEKSPHGEVQQTTRAYKPGRTFSLSISYKI